MLQKLSQSKPWCLPVGASPAYLQAKRDCHRRPASGMRGE